MVISSVFNKINQRQRPNAYTSYEFCDHLNISVCPTTEMSKSFNITVYNPIGRTVDTIIRFPVSSQSVRIFGPDGKQLAYAILPITNVTKYVRAGRGNAAYELVFAVTSLPPLGLSVYSVNFDSNFRKASGYNITDRKKSEYDTKASYQVPEVTSNADYSIENKHLRLTFSVDSGRLVKVENLISKISLPVDQQFFWYEAAGSGAYLFDPATNKPMVINPGNKANTSVFQSEVVQEVHQVFSPWVSQTVRLYTNKPYAEFEYTVGPIKNAPSHNVGTEVISRFDTSLKTNGLFYTDANGREMKLRKRNYRPTWKYQGE